MKKLITIFIAIMLILISACSAGTPPPVNVSPSATLTSTNATVPPPATDTLTPTSQPMATATPDLRLLPEDWQEWPVVPSVLSPRARQIYASGLAQGNDPQHFSKVGDCGSGPSWFLADFDKSPAYYNLGEYTELEGVIAWYQGSFSRASLAVRHGLNVAGAISSVWADPQYCLAGETPVSCEDRLWNPSIVIIMLGANDIYHIDTFEVEMRQILDYFISQGVLPVLSTKADNQEGDDSINLIIARLAFEYDIPLWNQWLAVQPLPRHGLDTDNAHLTWAPNDFSNAADMQAGWPWRNLTALQVLDFLWRSLNANP
jgi:hypothetical protein